MSSGRYPKCSPPILLRFHRRPKNIKFQWMQIEIFFKPFKTSKISTKLIFNLFTTVKMKKIKCSNKAIPHKIFIFARIKCKTSTRYSKEIVLRYRKNLLTCLPKIVHECNEIGIEIKTSPENSLKYTCNLFRFYALIKNFS